LLMRFVPPFLSLEEERGKSTIAITKKGEKKGEIAINQRTGSCSATGPGEWLRGRRRGGGGGDAVLDLPPPERE